MSPNEKLKFPDNSEIADPLLLLILECGGTSGAIYSNDSYEPLADFFRLDQATRTMTRDEVLKDGHSTPYWHNRVQWARQSLVNSGDLYGPKQTVWALTAQGRVRTERERHRFPTQLVEIFRRHRCIPVSADDLKP